MKPQSSQPVKTIWIISPNFVTSSCPGLLKVGLASRHEAELWPWSPESRRRPLCACLIPDCPPYPSLQGRAKQARQCLPEPTHPTASSLPPHLNICSAKAKRVMPAEIIPLRMAASYHLCGKVTACSDFNTVYQPPFSGILHIFTSSEARLPGILYYKQGSYVDPIPAESTWGL